MRSEAGGNAGHSTHRTAAGTRTPLIFSVNRPLLTMFIGVAGSALALRIVFGILIRQTYDFDEFVILQLARDYAHGAVPYRDFMFFHPPGVLVLFRLLSPLTDMSWVAGRWAMATLDSATAGLVAIVGWGAFGRREGVAAGLVYALSPLTLVAGVRVGQDSLITFFGVLGLTLLVCFKGRAAAIAAGACIAVAVWIKYPAALYIPIYVLLARRRSGWVLGGTVVASALLFLPFQPQWHSLYRDTVTFQSTRWLMKPQQRIESVLLFWPVANLFALAGMLRRPPLWVAAGFLIGGVFALSSQVYYHYFVPIVPFAALLGGLAWTRYVPTIRPLLPIAVAVTVAWGIVLDTGGPSPLYVTAASLPTIQPTLRAIERMTRTGDPILADRMEYAYLTRRREVADYFWNIGTLVRARYLKNLTPRARLVIQSVGPSSGYPRGFDPYLNADYPAIRLPAGTVWLVGRSRRSHS